MHIVEPSIMFFYFLGMWFLGFLFFSVNNKRPFFPPFKLCHIGVYRKQNLQQSLMFRSVLVFNTHGRARRAYGFDRWGC